MDEYTEAAKKYLASFVPTRMAAQEAFDNAPDPEARQLWSNLVGHLIDADKTAQAILKGVPGPKPILGSVVADGDCGCGAGRGCCDGDYAYRRLTVDTLAATVEALVAHLREQVTDWTFAHYPLKDPCEGRPNRQPTHTAKEAMALLDKLGIPYERPPWAAEAAAQA